MQPRDTDIVRAAAALRAGGIVAYPTEAVFGLGCAPTNEDALAKLLTIKGREVGKGLILIAADVEQLQRWILPPAPNIERRVLATWPGPVTWLMPARAATPALLRGDHETLAVRVTAHPVAAQLCREFGGAIVSTSANVSAVAPLRTAQAVRELLGKQLDVVVDAAVGDLAGPTQIRDAASGRIIRA